MGASLNMRSEEIQKRSEKDARSQNLRSEEVPKRSEEDTGSQDLVTGSQDKSLIYFSHLVSSGSLIGSHL
jgi:hypothetical protein